MMYDDDDMPPLTDADNVVRGPFIPPPPGATHGGQPSPTDAFDPLTGARVNPQLSEWMPAPPSWATPVHNNHVPNWVAQQQQQLPPPTSAQSYTYGHGQYPAPLTPVSSWTAPTPSGSWGPPTPAGSWGPPTPASANSNVANWVQQGQEYYTPFGQEPSLSQPVSASPWFGGGDGLPPRATGSGGTLLRKKSKRQTTLEQKYQPYVAIHNPYPAFGPPTSHEMAGPAGYPLRRTTSLGGGARYGYSTPLTGYPQLEEYNARNLARRPRDWRPDYDPRAGLASYMPRVGRTRSDVTEWNDPVKRTLCELLAFKPSSPPIFFDVRIHPLHPTSSTLMFSHLNRPHNDLDFAQLATSPPAPELRLYHPRLPWYIDVMQSHTNGVTVFDVLVQLFQQLDVPITGKHWWNEAIDDVMRGKMTSAFHDRTGGDKDEIVRGVKRVDYLRGRWVFEGLAKGRNGMWEMKMRKMERDRQGYISGW